MKAWRIGVVLSLAACRGENRAYVQCQPQPNAVACTVTHQQGDDPLNVCWQIALTCRNGQRALGRACQPVQPSGTATRIIPEGEIQNLAACDNAVAFNVENIQLAVAR